MSTEDASSGSDTQPGATADGAGQNVKIRINGVSKQFGRITALRDVSFDIYEGEIFALIGDNGAGKSTLMNVLSGVHEPTEGYVTIDGERVAFDSPKGARAKGIETVYQDLALMDDLDIPSNIFMGQFPTKGYGPLEIIDWDETHERSDEIINRTLDRDLDLETEIEFFSGGERQLVAIARALAFDPEIIILDEPTSALSVQASELVHDTIRRLQEQGITVIIVSHSIESVLELADRIGVLFQSELAALRDADGTDLTELTQIMTGRQFESPTGEYTDD